MTDQRIQVTNRIRAESEVMGSARTCFNMAVTPIIRPQVASKLPALRQAWWDGFLAGCVDAMLVTIGEKATKEVCDDLFERAQHANAEVQKALAEARKPS
jgi:hypothetical protein